jgi:hypothetical protein
MRAYFKNICSNILFKNKVLKIHIEHHRIKQNFKKYHEFGTVFTRLFFSLDQSSAKFDKLLFSSKSFSTEQSINHSILSLVNVDLNLFFTSFSFEKLRSLVATVTGKVRRNR